MNTTPLNFSLLSTLSEHKAASVAHCCKTILTQALDVILTNTQLHNNSSVIEQLPKALISGAEKTMNSLKRCGSVNSSAYITVFNKQTADNATLLFSGYRAIGGALTDQFKGAFLPNPTTEAFAAAFLFLYDNVDWFVEKLTSDDEELAVLTNPLIHPEDHALTRPEASFNLVQALGLIIQRELDANMPAEDTD